MAPQVTLPSRSLAGDVRLALAHPGRAWAYLRSGALLAQYAGLSIGDVLRYRTELRADREFQEHLGRSMGDVHYVFPGATALYVVVRAVKPRVIVETGVASGLSSAHILRALAANGTGFLHSIDLPNVQRGSVLPAGRTTGWIVPDSLRERWQLRLGDTRDLLPELLQTLGQVDLFLHDSDHSYENMMFEFEQALPTLVPGGLLMSDDTHLHGAWDDFCAKHGLRPTHIGSLGITRKERPR